MGGLAFVFPGQGSQQVGMGAELGRERPELLTRYLRIAEEASELPIGRLCREGPIEALTRTEVAQPALFAVGLALAEAAGELGLAPEYVAGHSLGEYTAAVVAGAMSVEDGMRVVCERGRLMAEIQSERPGTMAVLAGVSPEQAERLCDQARDRGVVAVANLNSPTQLVASGEEAAVLRLIELAQAAGVRRALRLQVGAAFHSELMIAVREQLRESLDAVPMRDTAVPLVSIYSAQILRSAAEIHDALLEQIVNPVRWVEVIQTLLSAGCASFIELGPGRVLSGLIRQIDGRAQATAADTMAKLSELATTQTGPG